MSTSAKVALAVLVLVGGFCAALPFRKAPTESTTEISAGDDGMRLRPADAAPRLVPLQVSAEPEASPAAGALPGDATKSTEVHPAAIWRTPTEGSDSPPNLERVYHPWPDGGLPPQLGSVPLEVRAPLGSNDGPSASALLPPTFVPSPEEAPYHPPTAGNVGLVPLGQETSGENPAAPVLTGRKHRLNDGDTLARLAERYYGDARRAEEIFAANRAVLNSPDLLPLGIEIFIPGVAPPRE